VKVEFKVYRTVTNRWRIPESEVERILGKREAKETRAIIYARVSSSDQKSNLERQVEYLMQYCSAKGYKAFGWKDQDVIAVGYQYDAGVWSARVGYNHATSPLKVGSNPAINMFNLLGFPATSKNHFTAGGTYNFSKNFSTDFTLVYSPKATTSASNLAGLGMGMTKITNTHSELGATVQFNYKF